MASRLRRAYLRLLNRTLNPITLRAARRGRGPFSLIRHVGRKTGRVYEAPVILADSAGGLVAELTYGDTVNWYRNIRHGGGEVVHRGRPYRIVSVEPLEREAGLRAFSPVQRTVLRMLRRREFRLLRVAPMG
ncbi:nitroreductase family deazaflavin-dependent oxidoreductase [Microbacterium sp. RD1]|uniref:nitroreductase family deazaflavin-dependent oxidoreductase n=1 Tax=Microbacterium sp. RD1 TaxID=3457313 RepID=UPI003FA53619